MIIKALKRIVRFLDSVIDLSMLLISLLFFLIGLYALYDSYLVYRNANDTSLLRFKPGYETDDTSEKEILKDKMVAWLTIEDTDIDYPVMQGDDNNEFLNQDPYGEYSLAGSIFLDSRNEPDFSDEYSLVYGHHMEHGMMFGALDKYLEEDYFNSHRTGTLIVGKTEYQVTFFAVLETEATNELIFDPTEVDVKETIEYIHDNALYIDEKIKLEDDSRLLGLSTCKYPDTVDRTLIFGLISKSGSVGPNRTSNEIICADKTRSTTKVVSYIKTIILKIRHIKNKRENEMERKKYRNTVEVQVNGQYALFSDVITRPGGEKFLLQKFIGP